MRDLLRKDLQANLRKKVSICDTEQDLEGKHGTGGYCNSGTKLYKNSYSMLNDSLLPPHVSKGSPCYVNIYLFIALLSDLLMPFQWRNEICH